MVGRLCARLAWKQTCLMLTWLESQLAFSEGSQSRALWSTDVVGTLSSCLPVVYSFLLRPLFPPSPVLVAPCNPQGLSAFTLGLAMWGV